MPTGSQQITASSKLDSSRTVANRANAQHSTGPKTEQGKAVSSRNAMVTGLTGRSVLLASDDVNEYILHLSRHHAEYLPLTEAESEFVQSIADCEWRLRRIPVLESGIYALGESQLADQFPEECREVRNALIKAQTYLTYQRQLSNLSIQESRLQRQKAKAIAAFEDLKNNRPQAPATLPVSKTETKSAAASPASVGFEFSTPSKATEWTSLQQQTSPDRSLATAYNPV